MNSREIFERHLGGKLAVRCTTPLVDRADLSIAYTPGVAEVCSAISAHGRHCR
jgi:malate dehydrogenase (oxaloacetate-decarboxylating)